MRASGILMPISSLPSAYGIGTLGRMAKKWIDFLELSGQTYWQILPVGPTGFGDSPYQTFSGFAGNPYFIDLEELCRMKLLKKSECESFPWGDNARKVNYERIYQSRFAVLEIAYKRFQKNLPDDFSDFCNHHESWLKDYALFMSVKEQNQNKPWTEWPHELKYRKEGALREAYEKYGDRVLFYQTLQYLFFQQWKEMKSYANARGIQIIGDLPIYVSEDSADLWANPTQFALDGDLNPIEVAGCPPDAFCEDGQLWGNPLYRWDVMKQDGYSWWTKRLSAASALYDRIRLDHFRGFDSYYAIPAKDKTARNGKWREGPGIAFFQTMEKNLGKLSVIAEDLGFLTPSVYHLLEESGFPGMKVLQFAFGSGPSNSYLPHNYIRNCVAYTGTHDNDTSAGWLASLDKGTRKEAMQYLNLTADEGISWGMIRGVWSSVTEIAITPFQDLHGLGSESRMNTPSTAANNWSWRAAEEQINKKTANRLLAYTRLYGRERKNT